MNSYNSLAKSLPPEERALREQRALSLGASNVEHLRLVADNIEDEGILELPGVDADRLRLLARQLEDDDREVEALREHSANLHRALCEAFDDLDAARDEPLTFHFITNGNPLAVLDAMSVEAFADLVVFLLDEVE